jgi:hypothetical protein
MSYIGAQPTTAAFVTDQFSGDGSTTVFTMSVAPANSASVIVAVSGVLQDPSTYAVSGTSLTFSGAPPTGTGNISARYLGLPASGVATTAYRTLTEFTATSGQTTFSVPSYTVGFINVYRNGVMLGTADFTATSGTTVVLAAGATSGDLVTTESFYVSGVSNAIPAVAGAVNTSYITDGAVTQAKLGTNVAGNGPAFSAYSSTPQTISPDTYTKITFGTEEYDTNSNFAASTFTPTVAGYYQINIGAGPYGSGEPSRSIVMCYKNGSVYKRLQDSAVLTTSSFVNASSGSCLVYCNGSTDYVEAYIFLSVKSGTPVVDSTNGFTFFQGAMVRAA